MTIENTIKDIADSTIGNLNKATRYLLDLFDPQNRNLFEIILYPKVFSAETLANSLTVATDTVVARLHIQTITIPFLSLEYANYNEMKGVQTLIYPETVSITFIETELGVVRNYLNNWVKEIFFPSITLTAQESYVFMDNQEASKKNALIVPLMGIGIPNPGGFIKLTGLKFKSIDDLTFGHGEGDPMIITATFSVENVWWKTLI